ncbi:hypothetical protein [Streptomyces sp. Y1]|uniref:Uncharacterized protein n=1 Tax=Streptomyces sp. Y1 TaxID=3238634 RepID=A0AB39TF51_9ACTN
MDVRAAVVAAARGNPLALMALMALMELMELMQLPRGESGTRKGQGT